MSEIQAPIHPKTEAAAALVKGAISAIPIAGGAISELTNLYLNPLEKRKQRWMVEVSEAINKIQDRFNLLPKDLEGNEQFVSFLYQATLVAVKSHQQEKLIALRNALSTSIATDQFSEDVSFQFLRYIDELTCSHLAILAAVDCNIEQLAECKTLELVYANVRKTLAHDVDRLSFRAFLQDLDTRFLVRIGDLEDYPEFESKAEYIALESSEVRPLELTSYGSSFLSFIQGH
ncbi:MAG: hypothetical protein OEL20_08955 [Sulfuritalea sp.]|nr:hypothetical protein [Sulfuritalea sp.]